MKGYWTVRIPYVAQGATPWHPTYATGLFSILTRGVFGTEAQAHEWALANLNGKLYSLEFFPHTSL